MSSINSLSPTDFLSDDQLNAYIRHRQLNARLRSYAESPEGAGLVSIKTSQTPDPDRRAVFVSEPSCFTGIPLKNEFCSLMPVGFYPKNPDCIEIDQNLMRLRRLKKNVLSSARFHSKESQSTRAKAVMVTLTYRDSVEWQPHHISRYIDCVKKFLKRKGFAFRYVWVYELTKRSRPHYHVLVWLPKGVTMPKADKRGWWPHGLTRTEWARHAVGYMAKYASKGVDDVIPKGVRLYGVGGLSARSRLFRAWWNLPVSVRHWGFPSDMWRRAAGGGWVSRSSGLWRPSQWSVSLVLGRVYVSPRPYTIGSPLDELLQALSSCFLRSTV